jgi:hypothetical protein
MTVEKRREAFIENKKAKMKQAQSLVEVKNKHNKKLTDILIGQNSDCDITYASLLANECVLEHIFSSEGKGFSLMFLFRFNYVVRHDRFDVKKGYSPDSLS